MADEVMDFGFVPNKPILFRVQNINFEAMSRPGLATLIGTFDEQRKGGDTGAIVASVMALMDVILVEDSNERFKAAMSSKIPEENLDVAQLVAVMRWLVQQVTARPTVSPDDSASSSETGGQSSTPASPSKPDSTSEQLLPTED
jgi:hypothetical protein